MKVMLTPVSTSMADNPRLTLILNPGPLRIDASAALLDRIEDALSEFGSWQELREVSSHHVDWDGSPRASLRLYQANAALGFSEPAAEALRYTISRLTEQPDGELLGMALRLAEDRGDPVALLKLRTLQRVSKPESVGLRLRWHQALRRVALSENSVEAVSEAWRHREIDPQAVVRVAQWLANANRWLELAHLRSLEVADSSNPGPALVGQVVALHRAGALRPDHEAVRNALLIARASLDFSQQLLRKAYAWRCAWLASEIRLAQFSGGAVNSFDLVRYHLHWLKKWGQSEDSDAYLDRLAMLHVFTGENARSLRRMMLRERRHESLELLLRRNLEAEPTEVALMVELAELADIRGHAEEARAWICRAREHLMAPIGASRPVCVPRNAAEASVKWLRGVASSGIEKYVQEPVTKCEEPMLMPVIELLAAMTQRRGRSPIWTGYGTADVKSRDRQRAPNDVRVAHRTAVFLAHLARHVRPRLIVEIGAAFGVSGMYWVSALEENGMGEFITFEPNAAWRQIAERNIGMLSSRARVMEGTFEDRVSAAGIAAASIDILSIDAIHTPEAISGQLEIAAPLLSRRAIILIDDINFSTDMCKFWREISATPSVESSLVIESRVGAIVGRLPNRQQLRGHG